MSAAQQYRAKAADYAALAKNAHSPSECRKFSALERSRTPLAANEWLAGDAARAATAAVIPKNHPSLISCGTGFAGSSG